MLVLHLWGCVGGSCPSRHCGVAFNGQLVIGQRKTGSRRGCQDLERTTERRGEKEKGNEKEEEKESESESENKEEKERTKDNRRKNEREREKQKRARHKASAVREVARVIKERETT